MEHTTDGHGEVENELDSEGDPGPAPVRLPAPSPLLPEPDLIVLAEQPRHLGARHEHNAFEELALEQAAFGEDLVVFRDSEGRVGVMDEYCPHRRASLCFGPLRRCFTKSDCAR